LGKEKGGKGKMRVGIKKPKGAQKTVKVWCHDGGIYDYQGEKSEEETMTI